MRNNVEARVIITIIKDVSPLYVQYSHMYVKDVIFTTSSTNYYYYY